MIDNHKPVITLFAAANRPKIWKKLYRSLENNKTPFEIIFVGNVRPKFPLPPHMKYIYSTVKVSQCFEIAAREASGEYILLITDDMLFSEGFLDVLYERTKEVNDDRKLVCPAHATRVYCEETEEYIDEETRKKLCNGIDEDVVFTPVIFLLKKYIWEELGGVDRRFITSHFMLDMIMRLHEAGYEFVEEESAVSIEYHPRSKRNSNKRRVSLCQQPDARKDRLTFNQFWIIFRNNKKNLDIDNIPKDKIYGIGQMKIDKPKKIDGKKTSRIEGAFFKNRLFEVESFEDKDITKVSQGELTQVERRVQKKLEMKEERRRKLKMERAAERERRRLLMEAIMNPNFGKR